MKTDWLIVGAGFTGITLAERIATQLDQQVVLIDSRNHVGGNAYDYYNHLRCKHLPRFDFTGVTLAFTLEMDHVLDGAVRNGSPKYPSVSWDSMVFYIGAAMVAWMAKLTDYAEILSGSLTPSTAASGADSACSRIASSQPQSALFREPVCQRRVHEDIHRAVTIIRDLLQLLVQYPRHRDRSVADHPLFRAD